MEFEQKAEEKKMSMSKNIARLAVTAGLTAALSFGGVMAPVTMAFAADGATTANGSVTIENVEGNTTEFEGYQISALISLRLKARRSRATSLGQTVA